MAQVQSSKLTLKREPAHNHALIWLALLALAVAALGGSSRFDAVQAIALRPITALFLIPALYFLTTRHLELARLPLLLLGLMTTWTAMQIVPLPPFIWHALPGREVIAELDAMNGLDETWRPISYVPMRGWNALFALILPISAFLLALAMRPRASTLLLILVALGALNAALGLMQLASGGEGALYFYTHTNLNSPVGIFANENHSGVFSAITLLIIARLGLGLGLAGERSEYSTAAKLALAFAFLLATLAILVSGSRAALGLGLVAYFTIGIMAWLSIRRPALLGEKAGIASKVLRRPALALLIGFGLATILVLALQQSERAPVVIDAFNQSAFEDLRWKIGPILKEMMATYWLFGSGFGSFDALFQIYEPTALMGYGYLNQAHNDWAQYVIEGGVPAVIILIAFARWLWTSIRAQFAVEPQAAARCLFWCAIIVCIAAASFFDYPLRTPIFQLVGVWLIVALAQDTRENIVTTN